MKSRINLVSTLLVLAILATSAGLRVALGEDFELADTGAPDQLQVFWTTGMHGQVKPCG